LIIYIYFIIIYIIIFDRNMNRQTKRRQKHPYQYQPTPPSYYHNSEYSLEIRDSTIKEAGLGVFAKAPIPAGTFIDEYKGDYFKRPTSRYYIAITDDLGIDAGSYPRCYMGMLNDVIGSRNEYNCEFLVNVEEKRVRVWSTREILAGEELFISYGNEYWK